MWLLLGLYISYFCVSVVANDSLIAKRLKEFGKTELVCQDQTIEPRVVDIVSELLPKSFSGSNERKSSRGGWKIPLMSLISDGSFSINFDKVTNAFTFNDIFVLKEKDFIHHLTCNSFIYGIFGHSSWCGCETVSLPDYYDLKLSKFCISSAGCTDRAYQKGECIVTVDPLVNSCILVKLKDDAPSRNYRDLMFYHLSVPTLYDKWTQFFYSRSKKHKKIKNIEVNQWFSLDDIMKIVFTWFPNYLCVSIIGAVITYHAKFLSETEGFQYFMEAIFGLLLTFILIGFMLYSFSRNILDRYTGPLSLYAHLPVSLSMLIVILTNPKALTSCIQWMVEFWQSGAPFGIWWVGKVYFLFCITISYIGSFHYKLFRDPESISGRIMFYSVKVLGLLLLSQGTPNRSLSCLFVLLGLTYECLAHWVYWKFMGFTALFKPPSYKYLGGKVTPEELEMISKRHTEKHLRLLKNHLNEDQDRLHFYIDRLRESGKSVEAFVLSRFSKGTYPGVPYTVDGENIYDDGVIHWDKFSAKYGFLLRYIWYLVAAFFALLLVSMLSEW